jgi:hypothetical protein
MDGFLIDTIIKMKRILFIITLALTLNVITFGVVTSFAAGADKATVRGTIVIVMADAAAAELSEAITAKTLERIYLKRKTLWHSGKKIVPINLSSSDPLRDIFTRKILRRGHRTLVEYWNGKHFSGIDPPAVLKSEEAVKRFLRKVSGSVGYIRAENIEDDLTVLYTIKN